MPRSSSPARRSVTDVASAAADAGDLGDVDAGIAPAQRDLVLRPVELARLTHELRTGQFRASRRRRPRFLAC